MGNRKNKILTGVLTMLMLIIVLLTLTLKPEKNLNINNLEFNRNSQFAFFLQNENKVGYTQSNDNIFPEGYELNVGASQCVDNNGSKVSTSEILSTNGNKVTVTSNKTVYCTLYFDIESSLIDFLREKDSNKSLTEKLVGDMYRYQGTDNVNNWLCFGTTEKCDFTNDDNVEKYGYRIIGITEDEQIKLIKETFIVEDMGEYLLPTFVWNDEYFSSSDAYLAEHPDACPNGICPNWNESDLFYRINGTANGKVPGFGNVDDGIDNDTDIFVDSKYYDYLKSGDTNGGDKPSIWYNLIENHDWMYGDISIEIIASQSADIYNGDKMYAIESGKDSTQHYIQVPPGSTNVESQIYTWDKENDKVNAKIGLQYMHDYLYAYPEGVPGNDDKAKTAWIFNGKDGYNSYGISEWLLTRGGISIYTAANIVVTIDAGGYFNFISYVDAMTGVRPVFYLSSELSINEGNGAKESPFVIDITV